MLAHDNVLAGVGSFHRIIQPMEHRLVSLLPLSHSLEQAVSLFYAMDVGADILYVRIRNPRVIFDSLREHRVTTMLLVPRSLDLFWSAIEREVEKQGRTATFERLRRVARQPPLLRPGGVLFRSVHAQLGGGLRLFATAGAFLPPALQQAWEDMGVIVLQGYGATETAAGSCTTMADHPLGCVGWPPEAGRDADRRRRRDPVPRPDAVQGLLEQPRGDRRGLHRRRLVQERRPRASSTTRAGSTSTAGRRTSSSCPTGSTCTPRTSRTRCASPGSATRWRSRRGPGGSRRRAGAGTHGDPATARADGARRRRSPDGCRGDDRRRASRPPTRPSARTSGSPAGGCGPRRTSRGPTRSRSSATGSAPGPPVEAPLPRAATARG